MTAQQQTQPAAYTLRWAFRLLSVEQVTKEEEVIAAFRRRVKAAADGVGGYHGDMDDLTKAKDFLLQAFERSREQAIRDEARRQEEEERRREKIRKEKQRREAQNIKPKQPEPSEATEPEPEPESQAKAPEEPQPQESRQEPEPESQPQPTQDSESPDPFYLLRQRRDELEHTCKQEHALEEALSRARQEQQNLEEALSRSRRERQKLENIVEQGSVLADQLRAILAGEESETC